MNTLYKQGDRVVVGIMVGTVCSATRYPTREGPFVLYRVDFNPCFRTFVFKEDLRPAGPGGVCS